MDIRHTGACSTRFLNSSFSAFDEMTMLILRPVAARKSSVCCSLAACPQSLVPTSVSSDQNCWRTVSRCGQVWRMCSGVCSSEPHSQWAESARPSLFRCFLSPQWPVRRRKMVVWVLLSRALIWSFCGSYLLFLVKIPQWQIGVISRNFILWLLWWQAWLWGLHGEFCCSLTEILEVSLSFFIHLCTHVCLYLLIHLLIHMCMYVCVYVCMYVFMYVCMYVCVYVCMYVCMCVCVDVCMYVFTHLFILCE